MSTSKLQILSLIRSIIPHRWGLLTSLVVVVGMSSCLSDDGGYLHMVDMHPADEQEARVVDFVGAQFKFVSTQSCDVDLLLRVERSLAENFLLSVKAQASDGRYFLDTLSVDPRNEQIEVISNRNNPLRELRIEYLKGARFATDTMQFSIRVLSPTDQIKNIGIQATPAQGV